MFQPGLYFGSDEKRKKERSGWLSYFMSISDLRFCKKTRESFMSMFMSMFMSVFVFVL